VHQGGVDETLVVVDTGREASHLGIVEAVGIVADPVGGLARVRHRPVVRDLQGQHVVAVGVAGDVGAPADGWRVVLVDGPVGPVGPVGRGGVALLVA